MGGVGICDILTELVESLVEGERDFVVFREEVLENIVSDLERGNALGIESVAKVLGPICPGQGKRQVGGDDVRGSFFLGPVNVGDHLAMEIALALGRDPGDEVGTETLFAEHFPDGFALAGGGRDGKDLLEDGIDFGGAEDAVIIGHFAGGNGGPLRGTDLGLQGGEVTVDTTLHQGADAVHPAFGEKLIDDLPIGGVPTDEEDLLFFGGIFGHGEEGAHFLSTPFLGESP